MARKREFDKDAVLEKAMLVFWEQGYEGTSIRTLKEAMGISSSSLYETFGDKRSIFLAALARFCKLEHDQAAQMAQEVTSATQFIETLFASAETVLPTRSTYGSMAFNTMVEFGMRDKDVTELLFAHYLDIAGIISDILAKGQKAGTITAQEDPTDLAYLILSSIQGFITINGMKPDFADIHAFKQVVIRLLNS
ncbi:TetR/AcrR family transcriptional regulator [Phototrophicus methaneseepsis]|uniref:TetR/AcrR family transcriptional regulator n=2 Tax=Phototrophicus methaneseepsis TaxID=2710758 RepID=A0A7S8IFY3_9CHLR|nr:TetR/AcrR family transcriptional regulator [Phototrophicus methaneseepsis]